MWSFGFGILFNGIWIEERFHSFYYGIWNAISKLSVEIKSVEFFGIIRFV